jgi:hypothetical protein
MDRTGAVVAACGVGALVAVATWWYWTTAAAPTDVAPSSKPPAASLDSSTAPDAVAHTRAVATQPRPPLPPPASLPSLLDAGDDPEAHGLSTPVHVDRVLTSDDATPAAKGAALRLLLSHSAHTALVDAYARMPTIRRIATALPGLPPRVRALALRVLANVVTVRELPCRGGGGGMGTGSGHTIQPTPRAPPPPPPAPMASKNKNHAQSHHCCPHIEPDSCVIANSCHSAASVRYITSWLATSQPRGIQAWRPT